MRFFIAALIFVFSIPAACADSAKAEHVIIISLDGLRPDAITALGPQGAPYLYDMIKNGASTLNARSDPDWTVTMPNHVSIITGRGVNGPSGHNYVDNSSSDLSIHSVKNEYVPSIFDAAKKKGLSTGFFASKSKFQVFINSYGPLMDTKFVADKNDRLTLERFLAQAQASLPQVTFIHFSEPDHTGHRKGWSIQKGSPYLKAVQVDDERVGEILKVVRSHPDYADSTVIFVTADHGGTARNHQEHTKMQHFRVPLIIWGKGVATGGDLYRINKGLRKDPGNRQVFYEESLQPIRNSDAANAALNALGLPPIEGSTVGNPHPLKFND